MLPLQFSRGCPYGRCTFCTYPIVEPALSGLRPGEARAVIQRLVDDHGVRRFSLKDSLFTSVMLEQLAHELLRSTALEISWSATTKVSRRLIALAPTLAAAGVRTLEVGVETVHRQGQLFIDKRVTRRDVEDVVRALTGNGIAVVVNLIFGLPHEAEQDALAQLEWFRNLRQSAERGLIDCSMNILEVVRGSPIVSAEMLGSTVRGIAPWAYSYQWDAPEWRRDFAKILMDEELG